MSRRGTGVALIAVAALLYVGRLLAAAVFGSGVVSWSEEIFDSMLQYVGTGPLSLARIALVIGVVYLLWAEVEDRRAG